MELQDYLAGFGEEPGYLDFAAYGPPSRAVRAEAAAQEEALSRARPGALERVHGAVDRLGAAVEAVTGFRRDQVVFSPNTSQGLVQAVFGVAGGVLVAPSEFPSLPVAAVRASEALQATAPIWLDTDDGRVTPGAVRDRLTSTTTAVAVNAVDARTGFVVDLEGIRQVIGDRLLIVDAVQAVGAVELPWTEADVLACGGQKWLRAGHGSGFLALSDRAANRLTPVLSNVGGLPDLVWDAVPPPAPGAAGMQIGFPDPVAAARLAAALDELAAAGPAVIAARVAERVARVLELADEAGLDVVSPRAEADRAGIVVVDPRPDRLTALTAALLNAGVSVTVRQGRVRVAPHAGTTDETLLLLRTALREAEAATRAVR
ncbi:aminotransferase class V-fold PLP-dependent enzyme [Amnibacterium sp. CER49]|uniref:aminotransferase class V-fold PLP-dependent enzyme n=1 Tax=Amnibacterium sp. CER49 TaxID=3039161 RepID=UPI00244D4C77|nr:aminotransferase class V-fold PLP-dependent enzyme [Amnibacterium sp. CER49]MDH2445379.1 aminotransferase class V-fold PLP-dependent enzyme [Amnibacterium sp. CER49]